MEKNISIRRDEPAVYVGTYKKYNEGSIKGAWLKLEHYNDREAFYKACRELHKDEHDPELMFQDYESFPSAFYCESYVSEELMQWANMDPDEREIWAAYVQGVDGKGSAEAAQDAYFGRHEDEIDFAYDYLEQSGGLSEIPEDLQHYFNYDQYLINLKHEFSSEYYNGFYYFFLRG